MLNDVKAVSELEKKPDKIKQTISTITLVKYCELPESTKITLLNKKIILTVTVKCIISQKHLFSNNFLILFQKNMNIFKLPSLIFSLIMLYLFQRRTKGSATMSLNVVHGGDLDEISRIYGIKKEEIYNFGGNVNPLGLPESVKKVIADNADAPTVYPDVSYVNLRSAIGDYTGINPKHIMVGNGSTELISMCIKTVNPKKAVIVSPAYSEYLKEIKLIGGSAELFPLKESDEYMLNIPELKNVLSSDIDMLVICNPNNPTGTYVTCDETREILKHCKTNNIMVMMDETYVEFSNISKNVSAMPLIEEFDNLFIIRGTSKFFACPGLRLGYGACSNSKIIEYINTHKDPWSVNIFAELSGTVMFRDREFINRTRSLINNERDKIFKELFDLDCVHVYDTQSNFFLLRLKIEDITSTDVFNKLIQKKILIRDCADFPYLDNHYIRFCILDEKSNSLLLKELKNILK